MSQQGQEDSERSKGGRRPWATPVRVNLLVIVILITVLNGAIIYLAWWAITNEDVSDFVAGALVGLIPIGITALAGLGTTLMNDK